MVSKHPISGGYSGDPRSPADLGACSGAPAVGGSTDSAPPGTPPKCGDPVGEALLVPYALGGCQEREALAFEAHLLGCETCFENLRTLDQARRLLREFNASISVGRDPSRSRASAVGSPVPGEQASEGGSGGA